MDGLNANHLVRLRTPPRVRSASTDSEVGTNESTSAAANWIRENLPELGGSSQVSAGEVVIKA